MDPLTHLLATRLVVGRDPAILAAGLAPDLPFYTCYPALVLRQRALGASLNTGRWPDPPLWLLTAHIITHSLPVLLGVGLFMRLMRGHWSTRLLAAWALHILIDIPTHTREPWGPRFLWPVSTITVDGVSWVDGVRWLYRRWQRGPVTPGWQQSP